MTSGPRPTSGSRRARVGSCSFPGKPTQCLCSPGISEVSSNPRCPNNTALKMFLEIEARNCLWKEVLFGFFFSVLFRCVFLDAGYRRKHIGISINEDGTEISISGEKPVQEKVIQGWIVHRKVMEQMGFAKVFRIPRGVVLDRIKARFNEEGSVLTITMPKSVEGIFGEGIEEVNEAADGNRESSEVRDETAVREELNQTRQENEQTPEKIETEPAEIEREKAANQQETAEPLVEARQGPESEDGAQANEGRTQNLSEHDGIRHQGRRRKFKICKPAVAGSALLVSLIVLVISWIKAKQRRT